MIKMCGKIEYKLIFNLVFVHDEFIFLFYPDYNSLAIHINYKLKRRKMKTITTKLFNLKNNLSLAMYLIFAFGILLGNFVFHNTAIASSDLSFESCINNTIDEPECKDCCDCIDDAEQRQECRDMCPENDFSDNTDFITVDAPSNLGPDGDYSVAIEAGSEQAGKEYCDQSDDIACGDRRYCRDAVNAAFEGSNTDPDSDPNSGNSSNISIEQAISDEAQIKTIAFTGLAFLTGDFCSSTFFPPGKVSDFFGFQYMRDITPNGFGHNTEFAGRISDSVLSILTNDQVQALVNMANTQADQVDAYGYKRFVLIKAFQRLLENDIPGGAEGLDKNAVIELTGDLYEIDAQISYTRASVIGGVVAGLSEAQKNALTDLLDELNTLFENAGEGGTINSDDWPATNPVDLSGITVTDGRVLVSTYATQLYSWYLGSVEGDTYFCPERHGTYFGSFYMKDIPPLTAQEAVTINEGITAELGQAFLDELDSTQENLLTSLLDIQQTNLNNIVSTRRTISEILRNFMIGGSVDQSEVYEQIRQYGEYEGEMMYYYATNYTDIGNTLTDTQADTLIGLRLDYYSSFPDYQANPNAYDCSGAWLYALQIDMPDITNTDFLFGMEDDSVVTLVSPSGNLSDTTPTYTWNAVSDSTWYQLWVNDSIENKIRKWYTAADAGCESGTGDCSITPTDTLASGDCTWWIRGWINDGNGDWSSGMSFTVEADNTPSAATLQSPSGSVNSRALTYTWNAVSNSTWYYLWVNDSTGTPIKKWYTASEAGCDSGTGNCSITPTETVGSGNCTWWIRSWNDNGIGPWSDGMNFAVSD